MIFGVFIFAVNEKKIKLEDFYFWFFNMYYGQKKRRKRWLKNLYFLSKIYNQIWLNLHRDNCSPPYLTLHFRHDQHLWIQPKKNFLKNTRAWVDQTKTTSIIASRVSIVTTTFNTTKHHGFLECGSLEVAPTTPEHQPLWHILGPSVRQANNFMFLSVVDTPLGGRKNSFFLSFVYCSTAGYTTFGPGTPPTNVTKSLVMNEVRSFPEGDNNKSCLFRSLKKEKKLKVSYNKEILYMGY
jgi:hypothetical protein